MKKTLFIPLILFGVNSHADISKTLKDKILLRHNYYRNLEFQDSNLTWDSTLALHAKLWANYLATHYTKAEADRGVSPHPSKYHKYRHNLPYRGEGENVAWASGKLKYMLNKPIDTVIPNIARDYRRHHKFGAIDMWANEKAYYDYNLNSGGGYIVGHYTQLVWQKSRKVGCAKANSKTDRGGSYIVCRYYPAGNIVGEKPYCTNYSTAQYYNNRNLKFTSSLIRNKKFQYTKLVEDRRNCTIDEESPKELIFNSATSGIFKQFDFFNDGGYVTDFKFKSKIEDGVLNMSGYVNENFAFIKLRLIGEDSEYLYAEARWSLNRDVLGYYRDGIIKLAKVKNGGWSLFF